MIFRVAVGLAILLGLFWVSPFGVLAEDSILPEIPLIELEAVPEVLEAVVEPVVTGFESLAEDIGEVLETTESILLSEPEEEPEEPELIWGCEVQQDFEGNESEHCGLGYYRTLCGYNEGVEECVTFFQFYEEEATDQLTQSITDLEAREFLTLSLNWNGTPLVEGEDSFPLGSPGTLGWSYISNEPEDMELPHTYTGSFQEMFDASTLVLQIYKGEIGSATLVHSQEISHASSSGEFPFTFTDDDTYHVILAATFPFELDVPGYECGGELCPVFLARVESLEWFMENARTYFDPDVEEIDQSVYFDEYDVTYSRMATHLPLSFGMVSMETGEGPIGISNVLFLPGIKGSRLYRPTDTCDPDITLSCLGVKLWEPSGNVLLRDLFLSITGQSGRNDIYAEENDIVTNVLGNNYYTSFINQMDALKADGTLTDWKPVAYDWRLSLDDIVDKGVERNGKIYYQRPTETPYIEAMLRELAASSPTGKVSLIAHSNGGLVAKKLMQRLEASGETDLVDTIIFVGVPQSGAPQAMAGLLYGYGEALPKDQCAEGMFTGWLCSLLGSRDVARELAEHSPMAYHLLPSQAYFDQTYGTDHPLAKFSALTMYAEERSRYGASVDSSAELYDFLAARDGGRTKPAPADTASANVLDSYFLEYAQSTHDNLDSWVPPAGVQVHQIAGWGMNTVSGVEFYEQKKLFGGFKEMYRPMFVEDGDGVVPVPSALLMSSGLENVENYWVNLRESNRGPLPDRNHGDIFELEPVRVFIRDILLGSTANLPNFISENQPNSASSERLVFYLHSPLSLEIYDKNGNHLGQRENGTFDEDIPNAEYGEFGEVKFIIAPVDEYDVVMRGESSGMFSLDVQALSDGEVTSSFTLADAPTTENTIATISVSGDLTQSSPLQIDENGDGTTDLELFPQINKTTIFESPVAAETEESTQTSTSGSSRAKKIESLNETPAAIFQEIVPVAEPVTVIKPPVVVVQAQENNTAKEIVPVEIHSSTVIERTPPNIQPRTQTASAYDAVGSEYMNWLGTVLYNFWKNLIERLAGFLSMK